MSIESASRFVPATSSTAAGWASTQVGTDLIVRGRLERFESAVPFVWRFGPDGRYLRENGGRLRLISGHDGTSPWIEDAPGRVRALELGDAERATLVSMVLSGAWRASGSLEISAATGEPDPVGRLVLGLGRQRAGLSVDSASGEPRALELQPSFGIESWAFAELRQFGGLAYPGVIEQQLPAGVVNRFIVENVERQPAAPATCYAMPAHGHGSRFDSAVPAELALQRSSNGFLLVRPGINGREVGWFIFDTGAGTNVITPAGADALDLAIIGTSWLGLAAGAARGGIRQAESLQLGPLTIFQPAFVELDLTAVSAASGVEIAGIIGYDVLMRAVVEIEVAAPSIHLLPPEQANAEGLRWEPIVLYGNHVYVTGRFEEHEGLFRLDTGAPQVPVIFNAPAVEQLGLLASRPAKESRIGVPGGTMDVSIGTVDGLEIGGHRFDALRAIFPRSTGGAFDDRYTLGNLGQECLMPFRVRFDYANRRAAFTEHRQLGSAEP